MYYDAEDGTLRDADGDEVTFEMDGDEAEEEILDDDEQQEAGGSQTPQPAPTARAQTLTSTSATTTINPAVARAGLLRNLSSATQIRVSNFQPDTDSSPLW